MGQSEFKLGDHHRTRTSFGYPNICVDTIHKPDLKRYHEDTLLGVPFDTTHVVLSGSLPFGERLLVVVVMTVEAFKGLDVHLATSRRRAGCDSTRLDMFKHLPGTYPPSHVAMAPHRNPVPPQGT